MAIWNEYDRFFIPTSPLPFLFPFGYPFSTCSIPFKNSEEKRPDDLSQTSLRTDTSPKDLALHFFDGHSWSAVLRKPSAPHVFVNGVYRMSRRLGRWKIGRRM